MAVLLLLLLLSSAWPWCMVGVQALTIPNDGYMLDIFYKIQVSTGVNPLLSNGYLVFYNPFTETVIYDWTDPLSGDSKVLSVSPLSLAWDHHHWWRMSRSYVGYVNLLPVEGGSEVVMCTGDETSTPVALCPWTDSPIARFYVDESSGSAFIINQSADECLTALGANASLSSVLCDYGDPKQQWLLCHPTSTPSLCWPHNPTTQTQSN